MLPKQLIPLDRQNQNVFGMTRTGKSYGVYKSLLAAPAGVLYYNVQHEEKFRRGFIEASMKDDLQAIVRALNAGEKICYFPSTDRDVRNEEFALIVNGMKQQRGNDFFLVADEAHLYKGVADKALEELVTTGISWGITTITISQRAANVNHTVLTQSPVKVFFELDTMDQEYFRSKKYPIDEIMSRITAELSPTQIAGHSPHLGNYIVYERGEIKGAYRI